MINQSLMRGGNDFTVFYSYNPPKSANNWVNAEVQLTRDDRLVHHSNYLSVPKEWLGQQFITEAEHLKEVKPLAYEHEYLGEVVGTGGEVFGNVKIRQISDAEIEEFEVIRQGIDFGYAADPFSYVRMAYNQKYRRLYIFDEVYQVKLSNLAAFNLITPKNKNNEMIIADSAEPKSINELQQYGLRIKPVKKFGDSIDFGVKFLSENLEEIIIDDKRCPNTAREFLNYELERDANGNFKAGYPDKNNHTIDAVRYAMNDECYVFKFDKQAPADPESAEGKFNKMLDDLGREIPQEFFQW